MRNQEPAFVSNLMDLGAQFTEDVTFIADTSWDNTEQARQEIIDTIVSYIPQKKYKAKFLEGAKSYTLDQ